MSPDNPITDPNLAQVKEGSIKTLHPLEIRTGSPGIRRKLYNYLTEAYTQEIRGGELKEVSPSKEEAIHIFTKNLLSICPDAAGIYADRNFQVTGAEFTMQSFADWLKDTDDTVSVDQPDEDSIIYELHANPDEGEGDGNIQLLSLRKPSDFNPATHIYIKALDQSQK